VRNIHQSNINFTSLRRPFQSDADPAGLFFVAPVCGAVAGFCTWK
jgi:hypothetical protein